MKRFLPLLLLATSAFGQTTVTEITPNSAPANGGVFVHIYGSDLKGFALACPTLECGDYVKFGDVLGGIALSTFDEIVVLAPPHAPGTVDVTVNVAGKAKITLPSAFTYEPLDTTAFERVLLPIAGFGTSTTPGALGSMWKTEVTFHNASNDAVPLIAPNCNPLTLAPCAAPILPPQSTVVMPLYGTPGAFVSIPRKNLGDVDIALRIQDVSRESQDFGTSLPVVRAAQFKPAIRLIALPTDPRFRLTLRIYGYGLASPVNATIFPSSMLEDSTAHVVLQGQEPAYAQLNLPNGTSRVEVTSATDPPQPIWAFVSVTNNETQHVTVIAPSP